MRSHLPPSCGARNRPSDFVWPNGLAFSEDFTKLYLALSDPDEPGWYVYDVSDDGGLTNRRLFLDAKPMREVSISKQQLVGTINFKSRMGRASVGDG